MNDVYYLVHSMQCLRVILHSNDTIIILILSIPNEHVTKFGKVAQFRCTQKQINLKNNTFQLNYYKKRLFLSGEKVKDAV